MANKTTLSTMNDWRMSRRGFLAVAGASSAAFALAACSPSSSPGTSGGGGGGSASNELTIMSSGMDDKGLALLQKYCGDPAGAKLKLVTVKDQTYAAQAASAQQAGNAPDLVQWTAEGMNYLIASGLKLEDLTSRMASADRSKIYDQDLEAGSLDGKLYALGFSIQSRGVAYRSDFQTSSITPSASWTSQEFGEWATGMNGSGRNAFGWESKSNDGRSSSNVLPLLWSTGGDFVTGSSGAYELGFTKDQLVTLFTHYHDMIYKFKVTPKEVGGWGYEETDGGFSKGTLASYSTGPFVVHVVAQYPDTLNNMKVAPLPNLGSPKSFWESSALMIHADSPKKDLAWKVMELARGEEYQQKAVIENKGLSVLKDLNAATSDEIQKAFGAQLEFAQVPKPVPAQPFMNTLFLPALQELSLRGTDPQAVAESVMSKAPGVITQVNAG